MRFICLCVCGLFFFGLGVSYAQEGEGGRESLFSIGTGARALGLGSAAVAFPDDPTAFYWNPAGMVVVQQKGFAISMTTLFEGTQVLNAGYIHPTLSVGSFGMGISYIGTGGIKHTDIIDGAPVDLDETFSYWWGKLSLAYALTFFKGFSAGINLELNRQVLYTYSTNGFGVDLGLHYEFWPERGFLHHLYLGAAMQNVLTPRFRLGSETETLPWTFSWGIAKAFHFRHEADRLLFLADLDYTAGSSVRVHAGLEYGFNDNVFARIGVDNGEVTFGGGLKFRNFQLDYGSSRIGDPEYFPRSHRFSFLFYFGRSIPQIRMIQEEERRQEIQLRMSERIESERQKRISEHLQSGKEYMDRQQYFDARLHFALVLQDDPENKAAKDALDEVGRKEQAFQTQREEQLLRENMENEKRQRDAAFINQRFAEGNEAFEKLDYNGAIEKWQQALERDPENEMIKEYIRKAQTELENEVNSAVSRANQLVRQENISEAYKILNRTKEQTEGYPELNGRVLQAIQALNRSVDFNNYYQKGLQRYNAGDYENASRFFERALQINPSDLHVKELYRSARARIGGGRKELVGEAKELYQRGLNLFIEGRYQDAVATWERALEKDPNNLEIIKAIEGAKEKIKTLEK